MFVIGDTCSYGVKNHFYGNILTAVWNGLTTAATLTTNFGFGITNETGKYNVGCEKSTSDTREYVGAIDTSI